VPTDGVRKQDREEGRRWTRTCENPDGPPEVTKVQAAVEELLKIQADQSTSKGVTKSGNERDLIEKKGNYKDKAPPGHKHDWELYFDSLTMPRSNLAKEKRASGEWERKGQAGVSVKMGSHKWDHSLTSNGPDTGGGRGKREKIGGLGQKSRLTGGRPGRVT